MTRMLALMKVYFSLLYVEWRKWMPKNVIECWLKCKNRYWIWFMGKCSLFRTNKCIFALLYWTKNRIFLSSLVEQIYCKLRVLMLLLICSWCIFQFKQLGSNPVEALIFYQASSFQLLKLENLLRWSFFSFIYNRNSKWMISCILHIKRWSFQVVLIIDHKIRIVNLLLRTGSFNCPYAWWCVKRGLLICLVTRKFVKAPNFQRNWLKKWGH